MPPTHPQSNKQILYRKRNKEREMEKVITRHKAKNESLSKDNIEGKG